MNNSKFIVIDFKSIGGLSKRFVQKFDTAEKALKIAGHLSKFSWHRRVEVWKDDFRLLLAVH